MQSRSNSTGKTSVRHPDYFQVLVAVDQFVNTLIGGYADETLSARAWRHSLAGERKWLVKVLNCIFFWQDNHCREAYESEIYRRQYPEEYRNGNS